MLVWRSEDKCWKEALFFPHGFQGRDTHKFQAASISVCCATSPALTLTVGTCATSEPAMRLRCDTQDFQRFLCPFKKCGRNSELTGHSWKEAMRSLGEGLWFQIFCSDYFSQISVLAMRLTAILNAWKGIRRLSLRYKNDRCWLKC